uniref:Uncharacterized protein n=1 Tax=Leptospira ellisii TaxID=2023197 RepID=A0A2N0B2U4_9LEPT|nr:hypothetical protein CH379_21980 [Leptospira ellisii]
MSSHTVWIPTVTSALQRQMEANSIQIFIVPGISNSGPDHWQTYWEKNTGEFESSRMNGKSRITFNGKRL